MIHPSILPYIGAFIIGLSKAGFATGLSLLQTPLIASAFPTRFAIGLVLPLLNVSDFMTVSVYWKKWDFRLIRWPLVGCIFGIAAGMFFVNTLSDEWLRKSLGILGLFLTTLLIIRDVWFPSKTYRPSWWQGVLVGLVAGFASTLAHAAGPVIALFLIAQKLDKKTFVATNAVFFALNNLFKVPPYVASGLITTTTLKADLWLLPMLPLGIAVGWLLNRWLPQKYFAYVVYVLLLMTAVELIFK
jgi:uncharacterized membrane protein YfcA